MRNLKEDFDRASQRFNSANELLQLQDSTNAYAYGIRSKISTLITETKLPSIEVIKEIHYQINQMLLQSKILDDVTVDISSIGLNVLGFTRRLDLISGNVTDSWEKDGLTLFEDAGGWCIGANNPMIGNEVIVTFQQLNDKFRGKHGRDLLP